MPIPDAPAAIPVLGFLAATSGMAFLFNFLAVIRGSRTSTWPQTSGRILRSRATKALDAEGPYVKAEVAYRFIVGGHEYESDQVTIPPVHYFSRAGALRATSRFNTNSIVPVFYDPACPKRSVLIPGAPRRSYIDLILTFALTFWLGHMFLTALESTRQDSQVSSAPADRTAPPNPGMQRTRFARR